MITINGTNISSLGVSLEKGSYAALLTPAPLKDFVENNDPTKNGTEVLTQKKDGTPLARIAERDVTLTFLIVGDSRSDFMAKYAQFIGILQSGNISLYIDDLGRTFSLIYRSSTQYDNYRLKACKLAVKFREPNPANR